ncbi:hypothetical protein SNEBB_005792 [Seison nebaliae]|nr:hypothetical protein SNEBB_005792 [Seison nebaliae]
MVLLSMCLKIQRKLHMKYGIQHYFNRMFIYSAEERLIQDLKAHEFYPFKVFSHHQYNELHQRVERKEMLLPPSYTAIFVKSNIRKLILYNILLIGLLAYGTYYIMLMCKEIKEIERFIHRFGIVLPLVYLLATKTLHKLHKIRLLVNFKLNLYQLWNGKKLMHHAHLHNLHIQLQKLELNGDSTYYRIVLAGTGIGRINHLSGLSENKTFMTNCARYIASQLHLNYVDCEQSSTDHILRNACPYALDSTTLEGHIPLRYYLSCQSYLKQQFAVIEPTIHIPWWTQPVMQTTLHPKIKLDPKPDSKPESKIPPESSKEEN